MRRSGFCDRVVGFVFPIWSGRRLVPKALKELARVLRPRTGTAEIRVPDLDALLELRTLKRMTDKEYIRRIFGDQGHPGDFHNAGFTREVFEGLLREAGLSFEKTWTKNGNRIAICRR